LVCLTFFIHPLLADYDTEQTVKRLAGRIDVEDALQRLDALTNEEGLMTAATNTRNLEVVDHVDQTVTQVQGVHIEHNAAEIKKDAHEVGNNMTDIRQDVRIVKESALSA
jgi:hypothetical protein